jgi:glycosyltransferase involved in cell wall biosynthesis
MKIIHIEAHHPYRLGYQLSFLAKYQKLKGHDVKIITSNILWPPHKGYEYMLQNLLGPRITEVGCRLENGVITFRLGALEYKAAVFIKGLKSLLKSLEPDIIHVHHIIWNPSALFVALWKKQLGYRLIYDTHITYNNSNLKGSLLKKAIAAIFTYVAAPIIKTNADYITAIGEDERYTICKEMRIPECLVKIIPLGTDTELFKFKVDQREIIRKKYNIKDNEKLILTVGKITVDKDFDVLLNAFGLLIQKRINAKLMIVGQGEPRYINYLKNLSKKLKISKDVIFVGPVPLEQLPAFYSSADIGVWTGGPTVCMRDAIACSLPIIIADNSPLGSNFTGDELICWGNGVTFPRGDAISLYDKMKDLITNPGLLTTMRKKAESFAREELSWEKIADKYLDLYKILL